MKSPRERAARGLCRLAGNPENTMFEGKPMWMSYLDEVDVVLSEAFGQSVWETMRDLGPPTDPSHSLRGTQGRTPDTA